jgi:Family of unknown function (DUF5999)
LEISIMYAPAILEQPTTAGPTPCPHTPPCPAADAPDAQAAHIAVDRYDQGWALLCNGLVLTDHVPLTTPTGLELRAQHAEPTVVIEAADRWEWAADRAERLLPEVLGYLGDQVTLPRGLEIVLCSRRRLAVELGRRTAEASAGYIGARYRLVLPCHIIRALVVRESAVWANDVGQVDVLVNVQRATGGDREFGAVLVSALVLASLRASYTRARHLSTQPYPNSRARYDVPDSVLTDLRTALPEVERQAAATAAAEWRERWLWTGAVIDRARAIMHALDAATHKTTLADRARDYALSTLHTAYLAEPAEVGVNTLHALQQRIAQHGITPTGEGAHLAADRRTRLAAAAWTDFQALEHEAEDGQAHAHADEVAVHLARALFEFDAAHGTGAGARAVDDPYWGATRASRAYTRQEWAAAHMTATTVPAPGADR